MAEFDPTRSPRYLGGTEDDSAEREAEAAEIQARLVVVRETEELFTRPGWKRLVAEVTDRLEHTVRALVDTDVHEPQADAARRGRAQVYRWLKGLPDATRAERDTLQERFRDLEAPDEGSSE